MRPALAEQLDLQAHPEGGWFRRIWTAPVVVQPPGHAGERPTATAIHYVLGPGEESARHRVRSDELWLWQGGGALSLVVGDDAPVRLGPGGAFSALVPAGTWQRAEPADGGEVLVTCVVSPGFDFADWELG